MDRVELDPAYQYVALKERDIRLIEYHSLHCSGRLTNVSVDHVPEYYAFSYCWGQENCKHLIELEYGTVPVFTNLYQALQEIGERKMLGRFWADGLCIDQDNEHEKLKQIPLMKEIYSRAAKTIVWLGQVSDDVRMAICLMPFVLGKLLGSSERVDFDECAIRKWFSLEPFPIFWRGFRELICHPWFRRLWTLQETVLASKIEIWCRGVWASWDLLATLFKEVEDKTLDRIMVTAKMDFTAGMDSVRHIQVLRGHLPLGIKPHRLILAARQREASNVQDYVYGLFGLLDKVIQNCISTNPTVKTREIFIQMAKAIINFEKNLILLKLTQSEQQMCCLPSWCPNFSSPSRSWEFSPGIFQSGLPNHQASTALPQFEQGSNNLKVLGICIDRVAKVVKPGYPCKVYGGTFQAWEQTCFDCSKEAFPVKEAHLETHSRTLCADVLGTGEHCSLAYIQAYFAVRQIGDPSNVSETEQESVFNKHFDYIRGLNNACSNRCYLLTEQRRIGLGPSHTEAGDLVCIIHNTDAPFILRKKNETDIYQLIGESFVHGVMYREILSLIESYTEQAFIIS